MVSYRRRKPRQLSPLFSVLDWLRIFCSGCFGRIDFKGPLLPENPDHLVLESYSRDDGESIHNLMDRHDVFDGAAVADDGVFGNDAESDGSDGMLRGHFLLGSTVLTEVELQSPVEESRVLTDSIRTHNISCASLTRELHLASPSVWALDLRRSNASSSASSARDLYLGSAQICPLDSDSCSSLDVRAVACPVRDAETSLSTSMKGLSTHEEEDESLSHLKIRNRHNQVTSPAVVFSTPQFYGVDKDQGLTGSLLTGDLFMNSLYREGDGRVDAEEEYPFSDGRQRNSTWNGGKYQVRSGFGLDCCLADAPLEQKGNIHQSARSVEKEEHIVLEEGQDRIGPLPHTSMSNFQDENMQTKGDSGQPCARSLTDQDFTELKGCIDLGFVFSEDHVPDLRETLPALEVCYAIAHGAISPVSYIEDCKSSPTSPPISPWRIASPGDQPQQVKTRLRHWAQAVACNVRHPC